MTTTVLVDCVKTEDDCNEYANSSTDNESVIDQPPTVTTNPGEEGMNSKKVACETCGKTYPKKSMKRHRLTHLANDDPSKKKYKCEVCDMAFMYGSHLSSHKETHLDDSDPLKWKFACDDCDKRFRSAKSLKLHRNEHTGNFPFKCATCDKGFNEEISYRKHMEKRHKNVDLNENGEYVCHCGSKYTTKRGLQNHKISHSDNIEERLPYQCTQCEKRFAQKESLKKHQMTHIPDDDPNKRQFKCNVCDKTFMHKSNWTQHMKIHLDDNDPDQACHKWRFSCQDCGRKCRTSSGLRTHMSTHTGVYAFTCDTCDKGFSNTRDLTTHVKRYHGTVTEENAVKSSGSKRRLADNDDTLSQTKRLRGSSAECISPIEILWRPWE